MRKSLRILQVCNKFLPCSGGVPYHVRDLAIALTGFGHDVHVLAPRCGTPSEGTNSDTEYLDRFGVRRIEAPLFDGPIAYFQGLFVMPVLNSMLRSREYDVIHFHSWPTLTTDVGITLARRHGIPAVITIHGFGSPNGSARYRIAYGLLEKIVLKSTLDQATRVISVSEAGALYLANALGTSSKITCVPNGIWLDESQRCGRQSDQEMFADFLFVGRFSISKGIDTLLRAFSLVAKSHPDVRLQLVGGGSHTEMSALTKLTRNLGIDDKVRLRINPSRPDVRRTYSKESVLVLPSTREGVPSVILEAFASETPVIAADVGGVRELVQDGITGILIPPRDPNALANAMIRLLENPMLRVQLSTRASQKVREFDWSILGRTVEAVYRGIA